MRLWRRQRNQGLEDATAARKKAECHLARVRAETPRFRALAASLHELREQNHFAEMIESTFHGGKSS